jgi:hypothetical protein
MQLFGTKKNMQREKFTCIPCLNTGVLLLLQTLALDTLQLVAHLKLARCLRAHKKTYNKQKNTPSLKKLKERTRFGSRNANTRALGTIGRFG